MVGVGFIAQKKFKMDTLSLSRLNIYVFIPALLFVKVYEAEVSMAFVGTVVSYILIIEILMLILGEVVSRVYNYPRSIKKAFCNTLTFFNSGNYGLPLIHLAFGGNMLATTAQVFIMLTQNISTSTLGVFQASSGKSSYRQALKNVLKMPSIYMLALATVMKLSGFVMPEPALVSIRYLTDCFIGFALVTLGAQLAEITAKFDIKAVSLSSGIRLILSPILGFLIIKLLGVQGELSKSLIIGVATPTAVNTAILAREFDNEPEYAAQNVFVSTLLSPITLSVLIFLLNKYM